MRLLIILGVLAVFAIPTGAIAQDECATAVAIPFAIGTTVTPIDTTAATTSADPIDDAACAGTAIGTCEFDIWFTWNPTADGIATMSTCNDVNFDTDLLISTGACGAQTTVACNGDGAGCAGFSSFVDFFQVTAGTSYTIRVGGWDAASIGTGNLTIVFSDLVPVSNLACTPDQSTGTSEVLMEWTEDVFYDNVNIYLDVIDPGSLLTTIPGVGAGGTSSFNYSPAADGGHPLFAGE